MGSYAFMHEGSGVVVDLAGQVLSAELDAKEQTFDGQDEPLAASVKDAGGTSDFVSVLALITTAKSFDDELMFALERLAHRGAGEHPSIESVCERIRAALPEGTRTRGLFEAAHHLARNTTPESSAAQLHARKWLALFAKDKKRSKPIGIYEDVPFLAQAFRHDRILQSELERDDGVLVREVLEREPALAAAYRRYLDLATALTGPAALPSVMDVGNGPSSRGCAVLPASDALESRLLRELFGSVPVPDGFELGAELVTRIRDGRLRTVPTAEDAWYVHQLHASAALLTPDTPGLVVGPRYRKELEEQFKALFTLNRETHAKQLDLSAAGAGRPPLTVRPRLTLEPLPELYARIANAYRHVRERLSALWGEGVLRSTSFGLEDGIDIDAGITGMELLFRGAEVTSRFELAQPQPSTPEASYARAAFEQWRAGPAPAYDLRVAVPVYYDLQRKTVRICATIGVESKTLRFDFLKKPKVEVHHRKPVDVLFNGLACKVYSLVMIECDVREPPSRKELRAICDREKTPAKIKAALEAR